MEKDLTLSRSYSYKTPKPATAEVSCFNCGKFVSIMLPFFGCIFCSDCARGDSYSSADYHPHIIPDVEE